MPGAPIDRLTARAVTRGEVAALAHEASDHAVECAALEAKPFLTSAQGSEVLRSLWYNILAESHLDAPSIAAASWALNFSTHPAYRSGR